jgi:TPR repeat protein
VDKADFQLGYLDLYGIGGPANPDEGLRLMDAAANSGNAPRAAFISGLFLLTRKDAPPDFVGAKSRFERGSQGDNADPDCMWALGEVLKDGGPGVPKNPALAMKWLKMAASLGQKDAIKEVGPQKYKPPKGDSEGD